MVLKNLFTWQQWRNNIENRCMDMGRGEKSVRCMERVTWKLTYGNVSFLVILSIHLTLSFLEPIIQSEVSQKEKDKYHILTHIYGI